MGRNVVCWMLREGVTHDKRPSRVWSSLAFHEERRMRAVSGRCRYVAMRYTCNQEHSCWSRSGRPFCVVAPNGVFVLGSPSHFTFADSMANPPWLGIIDSLGYGMVIPEPV